MAHSEWDPAAKASRTKVLYSLGRADELDRAAVERLITSLTQLLGVEPSTTGPDRTRPVGVPGLEFVESRPLGGTWLLDGLWHRLGIDTLLRRQAAATRRDPVVERVLFTLVANRALAPSNKLAATGWLADDVYVPGIEATTDDARYRAMDWLVAHEDRIARGVFDAVADLLNLEVDLIFFDTTSTYFETEDGDEPVWRDHAGRRLPDTDSHTKTDATGGAASAGVEPPVGATTRAGFRTYGKSKDSRDDLPQVVVGMAVTRDGIPVRVWSWPGNTSDSPLIRQVKDDMRDWTLGKVIWVADRGFTSAENRRHLMAGGSGYILGEKLRSGSPEARAPVRRGHRPGLQATPGGRTRLAGHETDPRPATGLPPARGSHPRPRPALLARPTPRPDRRDPHQHHLAPRPRRSAASARGHLHRPCRDLPADHRTDQTPTRPLRGPGPGPRPTQEDHRDQRRRDRAPLMHRRVTTSITTSAPPTSTPPTR
ncbi:MAG TPA: IS1634 family transposase [Kineosporiaceae bacterium]|nr:IS1634 family transposase [Kineosporiaceae bacterium]